MNYRDRQQAKGWLLVGTSVLVVTMAIIMVVPSSINTFRFIPSIIDQQKTINQLNKGES
jgi:hypothetical protein